VLSGIGAIAPSFLKRFSPPAATVLGIISMLIGLLLLLTSLFTSSLLLFFIATGLSGIGFGGAFSAIIQSLAPSVAKHERAGLFTAIFVVSYLALSVPAMLAGLLVRPLGLKTTATCYLAFLFVMGVMGLILQARSLREYRSLINK
jgi:MFS family permease